MAVQTRAAMERQLDIKQKQTPCPRVCIKREDTTDIAQRLERVLKEFMLFRQKKWNMSWG